MSSSQCCRCHVASASARLSAARSTTVSACEASSAATRRAAAARSAVAARHAWSVVLSLLPRTVRRVRNSAATPRCAA
eukprot:5034352-Prymnesium_polylepis.1